MRGKTWVVYMEPEGVQVCGYTHGGRLLTVHTDGEGFGTAQEEEGVEWREGISDRVYDMSHLLSK